MKFDYKSVADFIHEIAVICPACARKALVTSQCTASWEARFSCLHCSASKTWSGNPAVLVTAPATAATEPEGLLFGPPVDCFFRFPLWYQAPFGDEVLYAYNLAHLQFIGEFVGSKLRERRPAASGWSNQSLQSRLPKWLLAAKNRAAIQRKITELFRK